MTTRSLALTILALELAGCSEREVTFNRDVAPIVFESCASCHRPGESAPFSLLSYADVSKRGSQVVEVTESRYMPPWLPAKGRDFIGQRILTDKQLRLLELWVDLGMPEGDPADLPALPTFRDGWALGPPDLIVEMPEPYTLAASGPDVYRNFVIPDVVTETRYVRAFEFRPGNKRIAHHAFVTIDATDESLRADREESEPGFDGVHGPRSASSPDGFFLSWTPGREPYEGTDDLAWRLDPGSDVALQMHLQPSGKPETIQASVGLYFADGPPARDAFSFVVASPDLDIPAGESDHVVEQSYTIPVNVEVLAVLPHAHFLGKEMRGTATLPGGKELELLHIPSWDFNWQAAYRYREPVSLPAGTTVSLRYVYDNSADNPFNPNDPPELVTYGLESRDEMCEFWLQVVTEDRSQLQTLERDFQRVQRRFAIDTSRRAIANDPTNFTAHMTLGQALQGQGKEDEALETYRTAAELDRSRGEPHLYTGLILQERKRNTQAESAFRLAARLDADDPVMHIALGEFLLAQERPFEAEVAFASAVRADLNHFHAHVQLGVACVRQGKLELARKALLRSLEIRPGAPEAERLLAQVEGRIPGNR